MNLHTRRSAWAARVALIALMASVWARSGTAQPAATTRPAAPAPVAKVSEAPSPANPQMGSVTGSSVYVRSGSYQNYYAVTKLNRGDQVTVVGERFGWLEILPPTGTFSVIDKTYLDMVDDKTGVVNGKTWAFAGSLLVERRYAKQVKLNKGDRVQVIGMTEDGKFCKVGPPPGATLWISGDYVERGRGAARVESPRPLPIETVKPGELNLGQPRPELGPADVPALPKPPLTEKRLLSDVNAGKYQSQINDLEAEIAAESAKPVRDRVFEPILHQLQLLADQEKDAVAQLYAKARIEQLRKHMDLVAAVQEMRQLHRNAISSAEKLRQQRESMIVASASAAADDIVVRGAIRVSGIYNGSGAQPKRWRVVAAETPQRTLAYIEVPKGSPIDPVQYYGKYIGIRASARRLLRQTIPPIPVYTVEEIVILDPATQSKRAGAGSAVKASPLPKKVSPPTSRPAAAPDPQATKDAEK